MALSFEQALIEVWRQTLVENAKTVKLGTDSFPRHWLNIADAVRNIGNVPGAHPRPIPSYRFSKGDATLAYSNTSSFVSAYFEKIAR
jgi:hypothetical protein